MRFCYMYAITVSIPPVFEFADFSWVFGINQFDYNPLKVCNRYFIRPEFLQFLFYAKGIKI